MKMSENKTALEVRLLQKLLEAQSGIPPGIAPDTPDARPQCALVRLCECSAESLREQLQQEGCDDSWKVLPLTSASGLLLPAPEFMDHTQCEIERAQCAGSTLGFAVLTLHIPAMESDGMLWTDGQCAQKTNNLYNLARTVQEHVPSFVRLGQLDESSLGILYPHANVLRLQAMLEHVFDDTRAALATAPVEEVLPAAGLTLFVPSDPDAASVYNAIHLLERARLALERVHQAGGIYVFRTPAAENPTLVQAAEKQFLFFGKVSNE